MRAYIIVGICLIAFCAVAFEQNTINQIITASLIKTKHEANVDSDHQIKEYTNVLWDNENHRKIVNDVLDGKLAGQNCAMVPSAFVDLVIGPYSDTVMIDESRYVDGNVFIIGSGVLIVDNCSLSVAGQIAIMDSAEMYVRNEAILHFDQFFVGQYSLWLFENGFFEAVSSTISANGVMHFVEAHDHAKYRAVDCYFPDWTFRKAFEHSDFILDQIAKCGDIMIGDSTTVTYIDCDTIMPWLQAKEGAVIDVEFPEPDSVDHFVFADSIESIDGIGYCMIVDNSRNLWWSLETYAGCSLTVRNSLIRGCASRFTLSDTISISGIRNNRFYSSLMLPASDRHI